MTLGALRRSLAALVVAVLLPVAATAQTSNPAPQPGGQPLGTEQLDALVAPIALYPDNLLSQVLMAATYPLEVVQAGRWVTENKNLSADQLKAAVDKQGWDESVKGLVATPSVLSMMSSKLDWTQKLGDAVLAQQPDVMDAIQRLRQRAQANNKLTTTPQQKVTVQQVENRQVIAIEPATPDTVNVPYYDPGVAYGSWPYPDDQPYYFGYPSYIGAGVIASGLAFGTGYLVGRWASGNNLWGGGVNWGNRNIIANRPRVNALTANNINAGNIWQHNPAHRQGVRYNNANVQQRFGNNNLRAGAQQRLDFRGRSGQQVLNPGNRGGAGVANRGGAGVANRGGAGVANRPGTGRGQAAARPAARNTGASSVRGGNAFANVQPGRTVSAQSRRGQASVSSMHSVNRGSVGFAGGGGVRAGGGGGFRGGGGGGRGGGGGGRRSDIALKHDVVLLGRLHNGLGFYRFSYNGSNRAYVGVIAQEVASVMPQAVVRGRDGYLRVFYDKLDVPFETYRRWLAAGAHVPAGAAAR